jgi:hypothetical protein
MSENTKPALEYWYLAHAEQVGIIVTSNNRAAFMQQLYAARKVSDDPRLMELSICVSPLVENELWIIHKLVKVDDAQKS